MTAKRDTLFLDVSAASDEATDAALEAMHKSMADPLQGDIWQPHDDPLLRDLIEHWTAIGLRKLEGMRSDFLRLVKSKVGVLAKAGKVPPRPPVDRLLRRWTADEFAQVKAYLEAKPGSEWSFDDHMLSIEWIHQRWWPAEEVRTEAQWYAAKTIYAGRLERALQATMKPLPVMALRESWQYLPDGSPDDERHRGTSKSAVLEKLIQFGEERCAQNIVALTEKSRRQMAGLVLEHQKAQFSGDAAGTAESLETKLLDTFGELNRDWRRIALTEATENANNGFLATLAAGTKVKRLEVYATACPYCKKIHGTVLEVAAPGKARYLDGEKFVWVGKNNIGRAASPRKRVGGALVERTTAERWWIPAGPVHPNCFISPKVGVYTSEGWKQISQIKVGDLVLTHKGRFRPVYWVLDSSEHRHTGDVYKIHLRQSRNSIGSMTGEHPVLTDHGWVPAREIKVGDRISALAKVCAGCGEPFVNLAHDHVTHCGHACVERSGRNQFSTDDPVRRAEAAAVTGAANSRRMRGMTVEQRRELTKAARAEGIKAGYAHLQTPENKRSACHAASKRNYLPSGAELAISARLVELGFSTDLQYRVSKIGRDSVGRRRYWWLDIALPEQKIAIEIDGEPWHGRPCSQDRDKVRDADLQAQGWTVMRFCAAEAERNPAGIAEEIARVAMNHGGEYIFDFADVSEVVVIPAKNKKLYNFGVEEDESYIVQPGVAVHNCRGNWVVVDEPHDWRDKLSPEDRADLDEFDKVLDKIAEKHQKKWKAADEAKASNK